MGRSLWLGRDAGLGRRLLGRRRGLREGGGGRVGLGLVEDAVSGCRRMSSSDGSRGFG